MRTSDLRRFVRRDWQLLVRLKAEHWARVKKESGAAAAIQAGEDLRRFVRSRHPRWPGWQDRLQDIQTHARVSAALKSVVRTRTL